MCKECLKFYKKYPLSKEGMHDLGGIFHSDAVQCAFKEEVFDTDNWSCKTMIALRELAEQEGNYRARLNDESIGVVYSEEGYLVMTWYKDRGQTGQAWIMCDDAEPERLTLEVAENILKLRLPK